MSTANSTQTEGQADALVPALPIPTTRDGHVAQSELTPDQRRWLHTREGIREQVRLQNLRSVRLGCRPDRSTDHFLDQLEGLELTPSEWHTVEWFVGWDANENMAEIIRKARAAGPATS